MAEYTDREHYIPLRRSELVELLCRDRGISGEDAELFRQFARLISATFHFEYHQKLEELKDDYAPFNPDSTTRPLVTAAPEERARLLSKLCDRFTWLMERANFAHLDKSALDEALNTASDWGLNMAVDWRIFERLDLFVRGDSETTRSVRCWWKPWRKETRRYPVFQRLVVIAKLRPAPHLPHTVNTDGVFLKVFKDIPKMDLEMLLPGAQIRMPGFQRLKLGGSLVSGLGLIGYNIGTQILNAAALGAYFWGPVAALFGYGYRQYYGYQNTRTACNLRLTQNLYYQNLDNNAGVLFHLLDEAEEQECREALLAYYYLWRFAGPEGWTASSLDDYVEMDLERLANLRVDFEIDDALAKLERLRLVTCENQHYRAVPVAEALKNLDHAWDHFFEYDNR